MAATDIISKATCHVRSISLPSTSHPLTASVDKQLNRLRTSQAASLSSSLCDKIDGLRKLYERVDDLLQLPLTQQKISKEHCNERLEAVLNSSVMLLDMCDTTKDFLSKMKECMQELELSLRRRRGADGFTKEVGAYMISRKKLSKVVYKTLKNLKRMETKCEYSDKVPVVNMLIEAEEISVAVFGSLVSFLSLPQPNGWSPISKLFRSKRISCENINEVEDLDAELELLNCKKSGKDFNRRRVLKLLEALNMSVQELEENLECLRRRLVKTRVSLLNILNH